MAENKFYQGSNFLLPISRATGLPIDQINFLACELVAFLCGYPYRIVLGPENTSPLIRHLVQLLIGIPLTLFCFGSQISYLLIQSVICLALMKVLHPGIMEKAVFLVAMGILCICHFSRMYYDYGGHTLDITGPLMINTQKLTSLAVGICDRQTRDPSKLSEMMKKVKVDSFPSFLEFLSYIFSFHGVMCGPFCFYKDYIAFINGSNYITPAFNAESTENERIIPRGTPSPNRAILGKAFSLIFYGSMVALVLPRFHHSYMLDPDFQQNGFIYKMYFIVISVFLYRQKYYFAWGLSEIVNANAGLGFNGYNIREKPKWDLMNNVDFYEVEMSTNPKTLFDNWNKTTMLWLRYVVYERYKCTSAMLLCIAIWHGFYPGYYFTFIGAAFFVFVSRRVRHSIGPIFQSRSLKSFAYDAMTFLVTRLLIAYLTFPFFVLQFWPSFQLYRQLYFWMHISGAILTAVLTLRPLSSKMEKKKD